MDLLVRQWAPFPKPGWYVLWDEGAAHVWAWDAERVDAEMRTAGLDPGGARTIPETALHHGGGEGARLATCLDGFEGQVWRDGRLTGSRWWPDLPAPGQWVGFQRDNGLSPDRQSNFIPQPVATTLADEPWARPLAAPLQALPFREEGTVLRLMVVVLSATTIWYGIQLAKVVLAKGEQERELRQLQLRSEPVLTARGQALEARARALALQGILERFPDQGMLMAKVAEVLPKDGSTLREWDYANGRLRLVIAVAGKLGSSDFVKLFQATGVFRDVEAIPSPDAGYLAVGMGVVPLREPRAPDAPGASR